MQADEKLATFMDYCTYGHMIDNVVLIVTGTLHERDVQVGITGQARGKVGAAGVQTGRDASVVAFGNSSECTLLDVNELSDVGPTVFVKG